MENKIYDNLNNETFQQIIKQKDDIINNLKEIIRQKDETIKQKDNVIKSLENIINKNENMDEYKESEKQTDKGDTKDSYYSKIFKDFNIVYRTPSNKITSHGNKSIYTIIQLQDGRLASGGNDGLIIIYKQKTFEPEITIKGHAKGIYDIIQLKNGNLVSCSYDDKTMNEYLITESGYEILSQVKTGKNYSPRQILELENGEIGLVAESSIIFYLNVNNMFEEDFSIKYDDNQIGKYYEMILVKPGELAISGENNKIQFFELNSRKLKEIINIYRDIHWTPGNVLCMINERYLCVGGQDKLSLIDVNNKIIIREIQGEGTHLCLLKLNDNILLAGKTNGDITQWKIKENNLIIAGKKRMAHQSTIYKIIRFNNSIITCSSDKSIKIW